MDPIQSWLDAKEVRRLAKGLMEPAAEVDQSADDAGYGDHFEGFVDFVSEDVPRLEPKSIDGLVSEIPVDQEIKADSKPEVRTAASNALADAKRLAEGSGMLGTAYEAPVVDAIAPGSVKTDHPDSHITAQLVPEDIKKFITLVKDNANTKALFLIDDDGQVLIDEVGNTNFIELVKSLVHNSRRAGSNHVAIGSLDNFRIRIGASAMLEVIPCGNDRLFVLGIICPSPIGVEGVQRVIRSFEDVVGS